MTMENRQKKKKCSLSASETLIMKAIWDAGEDIAVPDLTEALLKDYGKDYKRTSIGTFLDKLIAKGFVERYRKGRLAYIHPLQDEEEYKRNLIQEDADFWFRGKISHVIAALSSERKISKEEMEEIRSILDGMDD